MRNKMDLYIDSKAIENARESNTEKTNRKKSPTLKPEKKLYRSKEREKPTTKNQTKLIPFNGVKWKVTAFVPKL